MPVSVQLIIEVSMFKAFSKILTQTSSTKLTLFSFILFLVFLFIVLPVLQSITLTLFSGLGSPDLLFHYSSEELYNMAFAYGELGRNGYIKTRLQFDLAWPVVYTLFLATSISWFSYRITSLKSNVRFCNLLPMLAFVFDLLENLSVSIVMYQFPIKVAIFSHMASYSTTLKWLFVSISFILLGAFLIAFILLSMKARLTKQSK